LGTAAAKDIQFAQKMNTGTEEPKVADGSEKEEIWFSKINPLK
jgi:hypothetical protein